MDEIDRAQHRQAEIIGDALARSARAGSEAPATGSCLNCGEALAPRADFPLPRRWCDSECREDWQSRTGRAR